MTAKRTRPIVVRRSKYNPLEIPNYTVEESARYLHMSPTTLWYWVIGESSVAPLTTIYSRRPLLLSFKNLVECFVLESLRNAPHGISIKSIRRNVEELRLRKPSKYPLADYQIATGNRRIYVDDDDQSFLKLSSGGQRAFKAILEPFLKRVDRNTRGISERLFPFTRREHQLTPDSAPRVVVIDPLVAYGKPVLVGSRLSTEFLLSRKRGGATIPQLARDYGRSEAEIEEAIYLEESAAA